MDQDLLQFVNQYPAHFFAKHQLLLSPEQEEHHFFFIKSGFVKVHTITEEGNEFSLALLGPNMYFPIIRYLFDTAQKFLTKYYYTSVTKGEVIVVKQADLVHYIDKNSKVSWFLSDLYYKNFLSLVSKLEFMIYTHSAYKRVCYFLLFLHTKFIVEEKLPCLPGLTHKEIAAFVGLTRESVSHQLARLEKAEIIEMSRVAISIKNVKLLADELKSNGI